MSNDNRIDEHQRHRRSARHQTGGEDLYEQRSSAYSSSVNSEDSEPVWSRRQPQGDWQAQVTPGRSVSGRRRAYQDDLYPEDPYQPRQGEAEDEYDTIGGLVTGLLGYIPTAEENAECVLGDLRFTVTGADERKVTRVRAEHFLGRALESKED